MGGLGSGEWYRWNTKATVDESLTISLKTFRDRLVDGLGGMVSWSWRNQSIFHATYDVRAIDSRMFVDLRYGHYTAPICLTVELDKTATQFGGYRWWLTCPLVVRGIACERRCDKLHLPPGARYFGCRKCYDLTYRTCQESHQAERVYSGIEGLRRRLDSIHRQENQSQKTSRA